MAPWLDARFGAPGKACPSNRYKDIRCKEPLAATRCLMAPLSTQEAASARVVYE
jgi:hypothetical protein